MGTTYLQLIALFALLLASACVATGGGCDYARGRDYRLTVARYFLEVQLDQNETKREIFESALAPDAKFFGLGSKVVEGAANVAAAIRGVNPQSLEDNTGIRNLVLADGFRETRCTGTVSARLERRFRNNFSDEQVWVFYVYTVEFDRDDRIERIYDQPFSNQIGQVWPHADPRASGAPGYYAYAQCEALAFACPSLAIPLDRSGNTQTCYQYVSSLRDINYDVLGVTNNPTQACIGSLVAQMANQPALAPFLCPLVAPGNGSPAGCFRSQTSRDLPELSLDRHISRARSIIETHPALPTEEQVELLMGSL